MVWPTGGLLSSIRGRDGRSRKLGFRPEHYLILSERAVRRRRGGRSRLSHRPRRHRGPRWACGKVARDVWVERRGIRGSCRRRAMTTARGRSARDDGRAGSPNKQNNLITFLLSSKGFHLFFDRFLFVRFLLVLAICIPEQIVLFSMFLVQ
ncbi:hypothetical protein VPH35_066429 [Triticum aestivum]